MTEPTKPQLAKLAIHRHRDYGTDEEGRSRWFEWVRANVGRLVASNKDLTRDEASAIIDLLESGLEQVSRERHHQGS